MRYDLKLNCISCGHSITLDENVYVDYEGLIRCNACSAILSVRIEDGKLKFMDIIRVSRASPEDSLPRR